MISNSFLLATGSADNSAYLFDIGYSTKGSLLQKLEGHKDRVYGVHWHPEDPILASCSADATIKLWGCQE
jgi:COMPASS component SWD3